MAPDTPREGLPRREPKPRREPRPRRAPRTRGPGPLAERPEPEVELPRKRLQSQSRRDFLLFAAGVAATASGWWWLLPDRAKRRLAPRAHGRLDAIAGALGLTRERRDQVLDRAIEFDDQVGAALYSKQRRIRTYERSQVTPLKNNYHGRTPGPEILPRWSLTLSGLASGRTERLGLPELLAGFPHHDQVTRLVCVEGWSAVAWWGGFRFADLIARYPPAPGTRWAALRSSVSLDAAGRPEPFYVSLDRESAEHPQTLLVTRHNGRTLTLEHGAPLRLIAPMKLGLKNIKAITDIEWLAGEPPDFWHERGFSSYDGL